MPPIKKRKKRKKGKISNRVLDRPKLFFILLGTICILFGVFIGDINILDFALPFYFPITFGLLLQFLSILIFVKQKQIKI